MILQRMTIVLFLLLMTAALLGICETRANDNQTEIKGSLITPYSPADKKYKAGQAGDLTWWPYPTWQIVSWTTKCIQTFPQLVPGIRAKLWPQEMFPFCGCVMDRFRNEWAYKDFITTWSENAPKSEALNQLAAEYGKVCIGKVAEERERVGYFPNPDGSISPMPGAPDTK